MKTHLERIWTDDIEPVDNLKDYLIEELVNFGLIVGLYLNLYVFIK
ncbi:MAG: hypothetical protein KAR42_14820 [candidate division Zixibacteria bacterium]|nr:hypothetical protein [candidate division Zixibacteria bacterium]